MAINFIKSIPPTQIKAVRMWVLCTASATIGIFVTLYFITLFDSRLLATLHEQQHLFDQNRASTKALEEKQRLHHEHAQLQKSSELMETFARKNKNTLNTMQAILKLFPAPFLRSLQMNHTTIEISTHCSAIDEIQSKLTALEKLNELKNITLHTIRKNTTHNSEGYLITIKARLRNEK